MARWRWRRGRVTKRDIVDGIKKVFYSIDQQEIMTDWYINLELRE